MSRHQGQEAEPCRRIIHRQMNGSRRGSGEDLSIVIQQIRQDHPSRRIQGKKGEIILYQRQGR